MYDIEHGSDNSPVGRGEHLGYADCGTGFQDFHLEAVHSTSTWGTRAARAEAKDIKRSSDNTECTLQECRWQCPLSPAPHLCRRLCVWGCLPALFEACDRTASQGMSGPNPTLSQGYS